MNTEMNIEKFRHLIDAYGAEPERWPVEHRAGLLEFARVDDAGAEILTRARQLDQLLDDYSVSTSPDLPARILHQISGRTTIFDRMFDWLMPSNPALVWRPVLASALPLVVGLVFGANVSLLPDQFADLLDGNGDLYTADDEIYLIALATDDDYE
jgi:hypothetical protein